MPAMLIRVIVVALLGLCAPCYSQQVSGPATEPTGPLVKVNLIVVDANEHSVDVIKKDDRASPKDRAERFLKTIADETGGRAFFSKTPRDLGNATEEAMRSLQRSFLVTFRSADTTDKRGFRKIEVKTAPGVKEKAIAPQGYFLTPTTDISKTQQ